MAVPFNGLLLHPEDSVVTVTEEIPSGAKAYYVLSGRIAEVTANERIPKYHKIAVRDVEKNAAVFRYGNSIGHATAGIRRGDWVHTHNLSDLPEET